MTGRFGHAGLLRYISLGWLVLALLVLAASLAAWDGRPNCDCEEVMIYGMLALGFPASVLAAGVVGLAFQFLHRSLGVTVATSPGEMIGTWALLTVAGYVQWFVLLPWLVRRVRAARRAVA